jgi:hypothetical protein
MFDFLQLLCRAKARIPLLYRRTGEIGLVPLAASDMDEIGEHERSPSWKTQR